jgi:CMP-N-acetylneuraminic acid synthetase
MKTFAFIFARGGSKEVPKKNIKKLFKKPLIYYSIKAAKKTSDIHNCFVSTDSYEIANIAKKLGSIVIMRPEYLAQDSSPEWKSWRHAIKWVNDKYGNFDRFVSLPATSPFRSTIDIKKCLRALNKKTDIVLSITKAKRSPWFNMVKTTKSGYLKLVNNNQKKIARRQDSIKIFDVTTVCYVSRPNFILKKKNLWQGKVRGVIIPEKRAMDIDSKFDFEIAELLMKHKKTNNNVRK